MKLRFRLVQCFCGSALIVYWIVVLQEVSKVLFDRSLFGAISAGLLSLPWSLVLPRSMHTPVPITIVTLVGASLNSTIVYCGLCYIMATGRQNIDAEAERE